MKKTSEVLACHALALALFGPTLSAGALAAGNEKISAECETALALSAAPQRLRASASVLILQGDRFIEQITKDGPLTCIVERNHADSLIPQCLDRAGKKAILPAIIDRSVQAMDGVELATIRAENLRKQEAGLYVAPARAGVSYMMSDYNYIFVASSGQVQKVAPHVMFYAPGLTNEDIGGSFRSMFENIGTPSIVDPGPHGYMVVYTQAASDSSDVKNACRGQLDEPPPVFNPFAS